MELNALDRFFDHPSYKKLKDAKDMDEKMQLASEIHGAAPWAGEPHRKEWKHRGLDCLIVRNHVGSLCGYVGVPPTHPYYGKGYDEVHRLNESLEVHGGLTYADSCQGKICHQVAEGEDDKVWWLGFDCAHSFDWSPMMYHHAQDEYRNLEYVTAETERLADQLLKVVA